MELVRLVIAKVHHYYYKTLKRHPFLLNFSLNGNFSEKKFGSYGKTHYLCNRNQKR